MARWATWLRATAIFAAIILSLLFVSKNSDASRLVLVVLFPLLAIGALTARLAAPARISSPLRRGTVGIPGSC